MLSELTRDIVMLNGTAIDSEGVGAWVTLVGCDEGAVAKDALHCLAGELGNLGVSVAVLMFVPVVVQVVGMLLATRLKRWVMEEHGADLFSSCRVSQGFGLCLMGGFMGILLVGVIIITLVQSSMPH
ncbi:hypothetical protein T484DRAFT_2202965 [Baffinella frigidus]|nr:hypothetical protein T484DRAFT_2202965 [Cryptophyta sp. CCMP2293]